MSQADAPRRREDTSRRIARYKRVTAAAVLLIVTGCGVGIAVPAGLGWDFANFYDAGHRVAAGQTADLYHQDRLIAGEPPQGRMRFWSAPISAALLAPLSWLPPESALIAFKLQNTVALFAGLWLLFRHCRRFVSPDAGEGWAFAALFASLCLLYQPFWTVFRVGGQTTPTVFLLMILALGCYTTARLHTAAFLLATAAMFKPGLAPLLMFLAWVSGRAAAVAIAVALGSYGLASLVVMGWPIHREFLQVVVEGSQFSRGWLVNSSLYVPLENLRVFSFVGPEGSWSAGALGATIALLKIAVVGLFVAIVSRSGRGAWPLPARRHFEFMMAICFWLLISQIVWEHYLAVLFIPLGYLAAVSPALPRPARRMVLAICALSAGQNLVLIEGLRMVLDVGSLPVVLVAGPLKAGPLILTAALLLLYHREIFATYRAPAWRADLGYGRTESPVHLAGAAAGPSRY